MNFFSTINCNEFCHKLLRKRPLEADLGKTELRRCLSTFDLVMLGVGASVGGGVYVVSGVIAHNLTGPALFLSFLIAGFAHLLTALCFAEFGCQMPKTGASYLYTYITLGEVRQ